MYRDKKRRENLSGDLISIIILLSILCVNFWFLLVRGDSYIDSDMASNVLAAVNANAEHTLLSRNWYYSTVIGIITDIHIFQFVLLFIKDNLLLARTIVQRCDVK